jgi:hypothetical protein
MAGSPTGGSTVSLATDGESDNFGTCTSVATNMTDYHSFKGMDIVHILAVGRMKQ